MTLRMVGKKLRDRKEIAALEEQTYQQSIRRTEQDRHKQTAYDKLNEALAQHRLLVLSECEFCDSRYGVEAFIEDFDKPTKVIWLCRRCRRKKESHCRPGQQNGQ